MEKIIAIIEKGIDGTFDIYFEENNKLPFGLLGQGKTVLEAISDFENSMQEMQTFYLEKEKLFPEFVVEYKFDIASFLQYYHTKFSLSGLESITGVNQRQLSHYLNGHRRPSPTTSKRIEQKIHAFADELSQVHFA